MNISCGWVRNLLRWTTKNSNSLTRAVHGDGHRIPFLKKPPLISRRRVRNYTTPADDITLLQQKWEKLAQDDVASKIKDGSKGFYARSFLIPKKEKREKRLINDLRPLNRCVKASKTRVPGLQSALSSLKKGDWLSVFDMKDGHCNVLIHPAHRKCFRFIVNGECHQMNRLPMGHQCSMDAFRACVQPHLQVLRTLFPCCTFFAHVDDVMMQIHQKTKKEAREMSHRIRAAIEFVGLPVKKAKSDFLPHRKVECLGFVTSATDLSMTIPPKKLRQVRKQARQTLRQDKFQRLRQGHLNTTIGKVTALSPACPSGLLHSSHLFETQTQSVRKWGWDPRSMISLDTQTRAELTWWENFLSVQRQTPSIALRQSLELSIAATDSSSTTIAGVLTSDPKLPCFARKLSRKERTLHMNVKESLAAFETPLRFKTRIQGTHTNIRSDSLTVVHALNKWGTRQVAMRPMLLRIFQWTQKHKVMITATYVNTHANRMADFLTRDKPISAAVAAETLLFANSVHTCRRQGLQWKFRPEPLKTLFRLQKSRPRHNLSLRPLHLSENPLRLPKHKAISRFRRHRIFTFPDLNRIQKTLKTLQDLKIKAQVILPLWHHAPWFNTVAQMMVGKPQLLHAQTVRPLNLHKRFRHTWAWISVTLSGLRRHRQKFRQRLRSSDDWGRARWQVVLPDGRLSENVPQGTRFRLKILQQIQTAAKF